MIYIFDFPLLCPVFQLSLINFSFKMISSSYSYSFLMIIKLILICQRIRFILFSNKKQMSVAERLRELKLNVESLKNQPLGLKESFSTQGQSAINIQGQSSSRVDFDLHEKKLVSKIQKIQRGQKKLQTLTEQLVNKDFVKKYLESIHHGQLSQLREEKRALENKVKQLNQNLDEKNRQIQKLKKEYQAQRRAIAQTQQSEYKEKLVNRDSTIKKLKQKIQKQKLSFLNLFNIMKQQVGELINFIKTSLEMLLPSINDKIQDISGRLSRQKLSMAKKIADQRIQIHMSSNMKQLRIQKELLYELNCQIQQNWSIEQKRQYFEKEVKRFIRYSSMFAGSQFLRQLKQKQWLYNMTSRYTRSSRQQTRLLYRLDKLNSTNFHRYIDGFHNLLIVIKLVNGNVIGGFMASAIEKGKILMEKQGFLFCLQSINITCPAIFYPKQQSNHPLVVYDDYFVIVGNSQLRFKCGQIKLYSNFGSNAGLFANNDVQVSQFLGVEGNEIQMQSYEIYQIIAK